jgi:hypothetical protein
MGVFYFKYMSTSPQAKNKLMDLVASDYIIEEDDVASDISSRDHEYYPTSNPELHWTSGQYLEARSKLMSIASKAQGQAVFDRKVNGIDERRKFDQEVTKEIRTILPMGLYEANREETWNFISLCLVPDLANWRFENSARNLEYDRHLGAPRNFLRRLWLRSMLCQDDPRLIDGITEDLAEAIVGRGMVTDNPQIANSILRVAIEVKKKYLSEDIHRDALIRIRRYKSTKNIDNLDNNQLLSLMAVLFNESLENLGFQKLSIDFDKL